MRAHTKYMRVRARAHMPPPPHPHTHARTHARTRPHTHAHTHMCNRSVLEHQKKEAAAAKRAAETRKEGSDEEGENDEEIKGLAEYERGARNKAKVCTHGSYGVFMHMCTMYVIFARKRTHNVLSLRMESHTHACTRAHCTHTCMYRYGVVWCGMVWYGDAHVHSVCITHAG